MSSAHVFELSEAPNAGRTLSLQLSEHMLGLLTQVAFTAHYLAVLFADLTVTVATFGAPYLQYRLYRCNEENGSSDDEIYSQMLEALDVQWDTYSCLLSNMLPLLFPMVAALGIPLCSTASFVAIATLIAGIVSVATSTIYKLKFRALRDDCILDEWKTASARPWRKVPNKSFWVFMSLPTLLFFSSVALFMATVILTVWERPVTVLTPNPPEVHGCSARELRDFKYILLAALTAGGAHFGFIITKLYCMAAPETTGLVEAA